MNLRPDAELLSAPVFTKAKYVFYLNFISGYASIFGKLGSDGSDGKLNAKF